MSVRPGSLQAVRGVPKLRMKGPTFVSHSADELATVIDGSYFAGIKADFNLAFGQAKYIGALWMAYLARQHPDRRFVTVSPGNTTCTQGASDLPLPMRLAAKYVMPTLGLAHKLDVGASKRLVDGVTDPTLSSGVFFAPARPTNLKVQWSTKQTSSPTWPTRRFRTTPTRPSSASSPKDIRVRGRGSRSLSVFFLPPSGPHTPPLGAVAEAFDQPLVFRSP